MEELELLWRAYAADPWPRNISVRVNGIAIGDLDDEVQDIVGSLIGLRDALDAPRAARLGLALATIERLLPRMDPPATREYFQRLAALARQALVVIATGRPNER